ncbi:MAG TPA: TRAP transporter large permease subunit [Aliidongia sp.]|uniref:TRAP transporter large permease n=1 Tax=Aliidongia sp. TaxID=1914230 RepID=UPI002DDCC052|nr:TRAP transporter large permease subunit [Aliidongia sp.]HEV2674640.1 TRAP transporter large permease subunit [Aliidongia sp.]
MSMAAAEVGKSAATSGGGRFDLWLGRLTEWPAAALVVVEICVLFAGVVSRYVINRPLIWSDELASILFLWLAMLGAVVALRRDEHMRLTAVAMLLPPIWQARLRALAAAVVAVFVLEIVAPARAYVEAQWFITTPALEIHDSFRVAAIIVGALLMLLIAVRRLVAGSSLLQMLGALAVVGAVAVGFWLAKPWLMSLGIGNLVVFFVVLVAICVAVGVPIAFSFGVATMSYLAVVTRMPLTIVVSRMDEGMSGLVLLAVPLFVFLGLLIEMTGLARVLVAFMASIVGHVKGGLAYVLLGAMYLVSGISGSKAADMAAVAPALFPEMKQRGAAPGELVALLSASGAMAETIPPSLVLITIGSVTGVSIAALFTGGLLPAAVGALALAIVARLRCRHDDVSGIERASWSEIGKRFVIAVPALILPFVIRAAVVDGIATATEVSTVGIVYTILVGLFVYRQFDWSRVVPILIETASLSGAILLIIGTATAMAWALTQSGFSHSLVATMSAVSGGPLGFLAISILVFTVLGSVLEGIPAIVLFGPLLFPVARALGINEVHYAIVVVLAMGMGLFAPPFGVGFYAACAIGRVSPDAAMSRVWPYLAVLLAATVLIAAVPWLSIGFL